MERIVNLTPHSIDVYYRGEVVRTIQSDGLARCTSIDEELDQLAGLPIVHMDSEAVEGLPAEEPGTYYIVSSITAQAAVKSGRSDLLVPTKLVRDLNNRVIGCEVFCKL